MDDILEISRDEFYQNKQQQADVVARANNQGRKDPTPVERDFIALFDVISIRRTAAVSILDEWPWLKRPSLNNLDSNVLAAIFDRAIRHLTAHMPKEIARIVSSAEAVSVLKSMGLNKVVRAILQDEIEHGDDSYLSMGILAWAIRTVTNFHDDLIIGFARAQSIRDGLGTKAIKDSETLEGGCVCGICRDDKCAGELVGVLPCGHWFDEECILKWLLQSDDCPACRRVVMVPVDDDGQEG